MCILERKLIVPPLSSSVFETKEEITIFFANDSHVIDLHFKIYIKQQKGCISLSLFTYDQLEYSKQTLFSRLSKHLIIIRFSYVINLKLKKLSNYIRMSFLG
jgi:hypothetical protein